MTKLRIELDLVENEVVGEQDGERITLIPLSDELKRAITRTIQYELSAGAQDVDLLEDETAATGAESVRVWFDFESLKIEFIGDDRGVTD